MGKSVAILALLPALAALPVRAQIRTPVERPGVVAPDGEKQLLPAPLSTHRRIRPFPALLPGLEVRVERQPFLREEYVPLELFWGGRLELGAFRRTLPAPVFLFSSAPGAGLPLPSNTSLGLRFSLQVDRLRQPGLPSAGWVSSGPGRNQPLQFNQEDE